MKNLFTVLLISLCTLQVFSQTVKTEYYNPYSKAQVLAKYQVNSAGEKHGWFKGYDKQGVLVYEYHYKNNLFSGVNKEYSTYSGSRTLVHTETYKEGGLSGAAIYYANGGKRVMSKGSYLKNEKHGVWYYENPFDSYGFSEEDKKGAKYLKFEKVYDNGKEIHPDGDAKTHYAPSGQLCSLTKYLGGIKNGEWTYYFPNGELSGTEIYGDDGKLIMAKYFHHNRQLKLYKDWRNNTYIYEGYDENGKPDHETLRQQKLKTAKAEFEKKNFSVAAEIYTAANAKDDARIASNLAKGKTYLEQKDYKASIKFIAYENNRGTNPIIQELYNTSYPLFISEFDSVMNDHKSILWSEAMEKEVEEMKSYLKPEDFTKYEEMTVETKKIFKQHSELESKALLLHKNYLKDNIVQKETMLVDSNGKPITKDSYLRGKNLYLKSEILIEQYRMAFFTEKDNQKRILRGKEFISLIESYNKIPESEWKGLNKQLKKVDDPEQIKTILKI